jgi:hypothetical protein
LTWFSLLLKSQTNGKILPQVQVVKNPSHTSSQICRDHPSVSLLGGVVSPSFSVTMGGGALSTDSPLVAAAFKGGGDLCKGNSVAAFAKVVQLSNCELPCSGGFHGHGGKGQYNPK